MINYKYCPQCKSDLDLSGENPYCPDCKLTIYLHAAIGTSVLIIKGSQVLLSKRNIEPYKGDWDTIGGFQKLGEDPQECAHREVVEETGLKIKITGILGIYTDRYGPDGDFTQSTCYLAKIVSGTMHAMDDISSLEWVDIKTGQISSRFKSVEKVFADLKKLYS